MTFRRLAFNNMQGNWHQYGAFFLSSVFSVMIFYIYAAFIFHPDIINGHIEAGDGVRMGLIACEFIILIFSFLFIWYSTSAFINSRKKEFGLLTLFGMTRGQMKRMVFYENMIVSVVAIGVGIGCGLLFSKLFFMAIGAILRLQRPIPFHISSQALLLTAVGFFALFLFITLLAVFRIRRVEIVDLLKASKEPKRWPLHSKWLVVLTAVCLALCYYMAYTMTMYSFVLFFFPILGTVIVGTYFLFTQASVAILKALQRNKGIYYKRTNLITVSQLVFKMKDNARILFMVSILSAVILTASGTFYVFDQSTKQQMRLNFPQTINVMEKGLHAHRVIDPEWMKEVLRRDGLQIQYEIAIVGVPMVVQEKFRERKFLIVSINDYNDALAKIGQPKLEVEPGHAIQIYPYIAGGGGSTPLEKTVQGFVNGRPIEMIVDREISGTAIGPRFEWSFLMLVSEGKYEETIRSVPDENKIVIYGYEVKHWENMAPTIEKLKAKVPEDEQVNFSSRVEPYIELKQFSSLTLFIGIFVSVLFFIASGSMIYFKLFTEIEGDREQFKALTRIGMTSKEIRRVVTAQIGIIFFVPCIVGIIHTIFSMKSLSNLLAIDVRNYAIVVFVAFLAMQTLYFWTARKTYLRRIMRETV